MILLIDNYDSFTFNLQRYLRLLEQDVVVVRNDERQLLGDLSQEASAIVVSPGPKTPDEAGHCLEVVRRWSGRLPILGICLGHQVIYQAMGGRIVRAQRAVHGKRTPIRIAPSRLFSGIASETSFARYHSLVGCANSLPGWLTAIAWSDDDEIMAVEHREHPSFGVQFHPESVLSVAGYQVLQNFLVCGGLARTTALPCLDLIDVSQIDPVSASSASSAIETVPAVLPGTQY